MKRMRHVDWLVWNGGSLVLVDKCDEIATLLVLFHACKNHLGTWDVFLRVYKVFEQMLLRPGDARLFVGIAVSEAGGAASLSPHQRKQIRTLFRGATVVNSMTLCAFGLENLRALLGVSLRDGDVRFGSAHVCLQK